MQLADYLIIKWYSLFSSIDKVISFEADFKSGFWWRAENITSRELMLGVPAQTSIVQWEQIARAILYGQEKNVKVTVIKVE